MRQSRSITSWWRGSRNVAPIPNRVSRSRTRVRQALSSASAVRGRPSTVIFIRHAKSTPTAYGMTASSVARTPPIGRPYPTCASGMSAPDTATGSLHAFFICRTASGSILLPQTRYGASLVFISLLCPVPTSTVHTGSPSSTWPDPVDESMLLLDTADSSFCKRNPGTSRLRGVSGGRMHHWRAALRSAARRPLFTLTTVVVLGFGIAANVALFSLMDAVLLRPLPYPHGERIVTAMEASPARNQQVSLVSMAHLDDWNRLDRVFDAVSGIYSENVTDLSGAEPERFAGRRVAPRYFDVFEVPALLGRTFTPDEQQFGGPGAAVISEGLWTRRYQRDPSTIGRRLVIGGAGYTIVGVMPKDFAPPSIDLGLPARLAPFLVQLRDSRFLSGVGRLKAGVTLEQARSEVRRLAERLDEEFPRTDKGWSVLLNDYRQAQTGSSSQQLALLFGAIAALLMILCANISGLMVGQLHQRERELAIRSSLGATRGQVAGVVLREGAVLAALSAALSLPLGWYGLNLLAKLFATLPRIQEVRFDWRFAAYTLAAAVATSLIFGGIPAWQATRGNLNRVLAAGGRTQAGGSRRAHRLLVAVQFSVTLALLAGAGLQLRSYDNLTRVDPGFRAANILTFHVGAEWSED